MTLQEFYLTYKFSILFWQYSDSIRQSLHVIAVTMAAYGDGYHKHNHSITRALSSMLHSGKYMINPELRAQRINELTQNDNIEFCKAFWSLTDEYGVQVRSFFMKFFHIV